MFAQFFKPKWQHPIADVRASAVAQLSISDSEQCGILIQLASSDPSLSVRQVAVAKVADLDTLMKASSSDPEDAVRSIATNRLHEVLAKGSNDGPDLNTRIAALKSQNDPHTLHYLINCGDAQIRAAALELLTDESLLENVAVNCQHAKFRLAAAERLITPEVLERVAKQSIKKDKSVYKIVRKRLSVY
jgi:exonuclease SbcC